MVTKDALNLDHGQLAAVTLFDNVYSRYPDKIKKLLESHGQKFTGDPNIDFLQIAKLSDDPQNGGRGRFFYEDLIDSLNQAHYFNVGDIVNTIKNTAGSLLNSGANTMQAAAPLAGQVANSYAPGSGQAVVKGWGIESDAVKAIANIFGGSPKPVTTDPNMTWPPESEFPRTSWNNLLSDPNAKEADVENALTGAKGLVTAYQGQTDVHNAAGDKGNAKITQAWRDAAAEYVKNFLAKLNPGLNTSINTTQQPVQQALNTIYGGSAGNAGSPPTDDQTKKLKELMDQLSKQNNPNDKQILGMPSWVVWTIGGVVAAAIIVVVVIVIAKRNKKKKEAEKKAG